MNLEVGPLLRTLRRQPGVLTLFVLEIAAGVATISSLLISGSWYLHVARRPSGLDEENLIMISTYSTGHRPAGHGGDLETAVLAEQASDRERTRATADVEAVTQLSTCVLDDRWSYPSLFSSLRADGTRLAEEVGWGIRADAGLGPALRVRFVAGAAPAGGAASTDVILTRTFAEGLFGSAAHAIGGAVVSGADEKLKVVGVIEDVRMRMPFMPNGANVVFLLGPAPLDHEARLIVRARPGRRDALVAALRAAFAPDATRRFVHVRTFDSTDSIHYRVGSGLFQLLGMFGAMLGIVVLLGALAATSFLVAQRTRQIGIRRALGATRADIIGYFLLESALATTVGSMVGVAGAVVLYRMMRRVFMDLALDFRLIGLSLALLWVASILATLVPALRAARVSPSVSSRSL